MGYYSDVRICTTKKGYEELNHFVSDFIKKENLDPEFNLLDKTSVHLITDAGQQHYFGWDSIKWYEDSDSYVTAIDKGLEHLKNLEIPYEFGRIGEDIDDITEYVTGDYNLDYIPIVRYFDDGEIKECDAKGSEDNA